MRVVGSVVGGAVLVLGAASLVLGAVSSSGSGSGPGSGASIVVTRAYVRAPLPPNHDAAAYFTVTNNQSSADRLISVASGAGESTVLHANGSMTRASSLIVAAHTSVTLSPGQGHVMIENVYGTLAPGDNVNLSLTFAQAGPVEVNAPVIAGTAPAP